MAWFFAMTSSGRVDQPNHDASEVTTPDWLLDAIGESAINQVEHLDLSNRDVTDGGLHHLSRATKLSSLDLRSTAVTDVGVSRLAKLNHLQHLDVRNTNVSASQIKLIRQQRPDLRITQNTFAEPAPAFVRRTRRLEFDQVELRDSGLGSKGDPTKPKDQRHERPPSLQTEAAIDQGLSFLAGEQASDGHWSMQYDKTELQANTAATGLALLAFLGAGHDHISGVYNDHVQRGLNYLIERQADSGDLFVPEESSLGKYIWFYSHGIASLALCEAYGMTHDEDLREPAQRALDFIISTQNDELGGWRYQPGVNTDTSVTGWLTMALKSGDLAGLEVPVVVFERIESWLNRAQASRGNSHLYVYNPLAPNTKKQRHGRRPNPTMTSVGLLMRLYLQWQRELPAMKRGAAHLLENRPAFGTTGSPKRDSYYWYYATQVMLHMGGGQWQSWNGKMHSLLVDSQVTEGKLQGSWNPTFPVPDRWAAQAGRMYVTTLNLLTLEVFYRHLPIYEEIAK